VPFFLPYIGLPAQSTPLPPTKSGIDVAVDYLVNLKHAIRTALQKNLGSISPQMENDISWIFCVPLAFDHIQQAVRIAIERAGFVGDCIDSRLSFVTPHEAAIVFLQKTAALAKIEALEAKDIILVMDCGEMGLDLMAYEVVRQTPFSISEYTAPASDPCG
jgi:hypothetical protein